MTANHFPDYLTREPDGFIHLTDHRIGLVDIVTFYNEGYSAEMLINQFPTLRLALIHKLIAFYLENRQDVDAYAAECEAASNASRAATPKGPDADELTGRLEARRRMKAS